MSSLSLPSDPKERSRLLGELLVGDPEWTNDFFQRFGAAHVRDRVMLGRIEAAIVALRQERKVRRAEAKREAAAAVRKEAERPALL